MSDHGATRRVYWFCVLAVILTVGGGCALQRQHQQTGVLFKSITVGPREHAYSLYLPRGFNTRPNHPWPMIVFLNGSGECGTDGVRQLTQGLLPAVLNKPGDWPFVVLFPQKPDSDSEWEDYDALVMACMDKTMQNHRIDPSRVYLTGLSQGGHGTWMIAARHPDRFAAIAPVCGYGPGGYGVEPDARAFAQVAASLRDMPVCCFHGAKDDVVPPSQSELMAAAIKSDRAAAGVNRSADADNRLRLTIYPDLNHGCWDRAYREGGLEQWFVNFTRPRP